MENFHAPTFLLAVVLSLCFVGGYGLTNQVEALDKLYRAKSSSSGIDTSNNFDVEVEAAFFSEDLYESNNGGSISNYNRVSAQEGLKKKDKIKKLPGQPAVNFDLYSGYVTVDNSKGRAIFYYFAEAPRKSKDSDDLPLLLWLNGGPGCSSMAYGAMQELGPFRVHSDGKTLFRNQFAWNNVANVLFLESPAGVGFSYSNTTSDIKSNGDRTMAADNYWFLRNWLQRFPEYKDRDLYIAGESYAGHYVPQLAHFVLAMNKKVNVNNVINLKGIMIGNDETDEKGMYDYLWTHALSSDENHRTIEAECDFRPDANRSAKCLKAAGEAWSLAIKYIEIYNIYYPLCHDTNLTVRPKRASVMQFDPCGDDYVHAYLNTPKVQEALHANVTRMSYDWQPCSEVLNKWTDSPTSIISLLKEFMAKGLRVWVFSGDTDGRVPVTSTRYSIDVMNLTTTTLCWVEPDSSTPSKKSKMASLKKSMVIVQRRKFLPSTFHCRTPWLKGGFEELSLHKGWRL